MNPAELQRMARDAVQSAGITGESGIAVHEGFASSRANTLEDAFGDVIPGASLLLNGARRVVLVTDQNVYLFKGRRFDRLGPRLGVYRVDPSVMSFDGKKLTFPDGQIVYLTPLQANQLAAAANVDMSVDIAKEMLRRAGITDETALTVQRATCPKPSKNSIGSRIFDVTLGGGELDFRDASEHRIVLVTDRSVYIYEGSEPAKAGQPLHHYPAGPGVPSRDHATVTFPNGEAFTFSSSRDAQLVIDAAAHAQTRTTHGPAF
jgi:hypothetical protein